MLDNPSNFATARRDLAPDGSATVELPPSPEPEPAATDLAEPPAELGSESPALTYARDAWEASDMTSLATETIPPAIVRAVFGSAFHFTRGWAPPSAGVDPISGFAGHSGVDVAAKAGTPVYALAGGVVNFAGDAGRQAGTGHPSLAYRLNGGGLSVSVRVDESTGTDFQYAHLSGVTVQPGQAVQPGQLIGYVGSTGISTGPHLLFSIRQGGGATSSGGAVDPLPFLSALVKGGWSPPVASGYVSPASLGAKGPDIAPKVTAAAAPRITATTSSGSHVSVTNSDLLGLGLLAIGALLLVVVIAGGRGSEAPA